MSEYHNWISAAGAVILLVTYFLLQVNRIDPTSMLYSQLNFVGSAMIVFSLCFNFNLGAFVVEFAWMLISIVGAIVTWRSKSSSHSQAPSN